MSWLSATFAALELPHFRILWFGVFTSFLAFFMSTVVQSVVAFDLLQTNSAVGYVVAAQGIAMVVLGPLGGAFADRLPKKLVIAIGQLISALVFALLAVALTTETIRIAFLAAGSLVMGATFAFGGPARQALVVEVVPPKRRGNAMALSQIANTASRVLGPAAAGALLAWKLAGPAGAYVVMAGLYGISAASLLFLPSSKARSGSEKTHVFSDLADGVRYVWGRKRLRVLLAFFIGIITVGFPHVTVLPGLVKNQLGREVESISLLYLVAAIGALLTSLTVARFADSARAVGIFSGMGLLFGLALFAMAAVPSYEIALFSMFLVGAGSGGFQSLSGAVIVKEADPAYIGRVMSLSMLAYGFFGLTSLPVGLLADAIGERLTLAALGGAVCSVAAVAWWGLHALPDGENGETA